jgi:hypothetical protein
MSRTVLGADSLIDMKLRTGEAAMGVECCVEGKGYFPNRRDNLYRGLLEVHRYQSV